MKNSGFTLVELLVVITLVGLIGAIISQSFILGIRSQSKSEIVKEVKQNGDYALSVIDEMVRNATDITLFCNTSTDQLSIVNQDGGTTTFDCSSDKEIASISGAAPTPFPITNDRVIVTNCNFRIVCPTPPLSPKYVFISFTVKQAAVPNQPTPLPENRASIEYQTTISLRNY